MAAGSLKFQEGSKKRLSAALLPGVRGAVKFDPLLARDGIAHVAFDQRVRIAFRR
jgi:hypothetical protein